MNERYSTAFPEFTVLLVGNRPDGCAKLARTLQSVPLKLHAVVCCHDASAVLVSDDIAAVVTEAEVMDGNWKTILEEARRLRIPPNVIVVSDEPNWHLWADVLTSGGFDVLSPPFSADTAAWMVKSACRRWQRARDVAEERRRNTLSHEMYY